MNRAQQYQELKQELDKKYGELKPAELLKTCKKLQENAKEAQADFIKALWYMEYGENFKKAPGCKHLTFEQFLWDNFGMREGTYKEQQYAIIHFPKESQSYGPRLVAKIKKECGVAETGKVLTEINAKAASLKTPITREQIGVIIKKHAHTKKSKPRVNWKAEYYRVKRELDETMRLLRETENELAQANQRIVKLIAARKEEPIVYKPKDPPVDGPRPQA